MQALTLIPATHTLDSREVAEMVGKRHDHLMRDIETYIKYLLESTDPKLGASNFFIESTYQDGTGRTRLDNTVLAIVALLIQDGEAALSA